MKHLFYVLGVIVVVAVTIVIASAYDNNNIAASYNTKNDIHPHISIITSLYKGDLFIKGFLEDITRQTIFNECELILINAASPGNEEPIILEYVQKYPNIVYIKLKKDPGLYAVWNMAIRMARGEFIANANIDDRLHPQCYELFLNSLLSHPEIDLVYSDFYYSTIPNETYENNNHQRIQHLPEFNKESLWSGVCLPNNHPLWRKSMNEKYGYFDEWYKIIGDYEMWLRAVSGGAQFMRIDGVYGMFYINPHGLTCGTENTTRLYEEHRNVNFVYKQGPIDKNNIAAIINEKNDLHPRISIITSLFKGDLFIKGFLEDISRQTIFNECELIVINAASPGNEEPIILDYVHKYPNIVYIKLKRDPGLYAVWNMAIRMARGEFIANANIDDRLHPQCYEVFLKTLLKHPEVDLVYSDFYYSTTPNETYENNDHMHIEHMPEFDKEPLWRGTCLPNNHPLWRKSMHTKYGYFNEWYKIIGDYEMWLRAVSGGAKFMRVDGAYGTFYINRSGLSCGNNSNRLAEEHRRVDALYKQAA